VRLTGARKNLIERYMIDAEEAAAREEAAAAKAAVDAEAARREAEAAAQREAEERARLEADAAARREAQERARRETEAEARREAAQRTRLEAEEAAKREAEERARIAAQAVVCEAAKDARISDRPTDDARNGDAPASEPTADLPIYAWVQAAESNNPTDRDAELPRALVEAKRANTVRLRERLGV
jgi:membrane protein involved in colicin uptake